MIDKSRKDQIDRICNVFGKSISEIGPMEMKDLERLVDRIHDLICFDGGVPEGWSQNVLGPNGELVGP